MNGHVITKFSGMGRFNYPWCSAGALRAPELRYQGRPERQDIYTIDITPQFMLTLTYSNSVLCHAQLEIVIIYHIML